MGAIDEMKCEMSIIQDKIVVALTEVRTWEMDSLLTTSSIPLVVSHVIRVKSLFLFFMRSHQGGSVSIFHGSDCSGNVSIFQTHTDDGHVSIFHGYECSSNVSILHAYIDGLQRRGFVSRD